jgi:HAE1 family hydrophobic/amphiphilic exporter-1
VSQILTLFTTPVIYLYLDQLSNFFARFASHPEADDPEADARSEPERLPEHREAAE